MLPRLHFDLVLACAEASDVSSIHVVSLMSEVAMVVLDSGDTIDGANQSATAIMV